VGQFLARFIRKPSVEIESIHWEAFLVNLFWIWVVAIIIGICLALYFYREAVAAFKVRSSDDVFRPFTPINSLAWALSALVIMALCSIGYYYFRFRAFGGSFFGTGVMLGCISALIAFLCAYIAISQFGVYTPKHLRYRAMKLQA